MSIPELRWSSRSWVRISLSDTWRWGRSAWKSSQTSLCTACRHTSTCAVSGRFQRASAPKVCPMEMVLTGVPLLPSNAPPQVVLVRPAIVRERAEDTPSMGFFPNG